ncbi:hypothetical protein COSO111634_21595 [Corallococcus soli]
MRSSFGFTSITRATSSSTGKDSERMTSWSVAKFTCSRMTILLPTVRASGQPSLPRLPAGTSGHLSSRSTTPSLSPSESGQPPFSTGPATVGQRSFSPMTKSPSGSTGGGGGSGGSLKRSMASHSRVLAGTQMMDVKKLRLGDASEQPQPRPPPKVKVMPVELYQRRPMSSSAGICRGWSGSFSRPTAPFTMPSRVTPLPRSRGTSVPTPKGAMSPMFTPLKMRSGRFQKPPLRARRMPDSKR